MDILSEYIVVSPSELRKAVEAGPTEPGLGDMLPEDHHVSLTKKRTLHLLKHGHYSLVSAGRNSEHSEEGKMAHDDVKFRQRHEALRQDLHRAGLKHTEIDGHWGHPEKSFIVHHKPRHDDSDTHNRSFMVHHKHESEHALIRALGKKHNQHSVIHSKNGVHENHIVSGSKEGTHNKGENHQILDIDRPEYYSSVPHPGGKNTKFELNFDWDKYHSLDDAIHKSMSTNSLVTMPRSIVLGVAEIMSEVEKGGGGAGSRGGNVLYVDANGRAHYASKKFKDHSEYHAHHSKTTPEDHKELEEAHRRMRHEGADEDNEFHGLMEDSHRHASEGKPGLAADSAVRATAASSKEASGKKTGKRKARSGKPQHKTESEKKKKDRKGKEEDFFVNDASAAGASAAADPTRTAVLAAAKVPGKLLKRSFGGYAVVTRAN
jgi:hypothetical protein